MVSTKPLLLLEPPRIRRKHSHLARTSTAQKNLTQQGLSKFERVEAYFDLIILPNPKSTNIPATPNSLPFKGVRGRAWVGQKAAKTRK